MEPDQITNIKSTGYQVGGEQKKSPSYFEIYDDAVNHRRQLNANKVILNYMVKYGSGALLILIVAYFTIQLDKTYDIRKKAHVQTEKAVAIEPELLEIRGDVKIIEDKNVSDYKYIEF